MSFLINPPVPMAICASSGDSLVRDLIPSLWRSRECPLQGVFTVFLLPYTFLPSTKWSWTYKWAFSLVSTEVEYDTKKKKLKRIKFLNFFTGHTHGTMARVTGYSKCSTRILAGKMSSEKRFQFQ